MKVKYLIAAIAVFAFAGCTQIETELLPDDIKTEDGIFKIKAILEGTDEPDTKTVLGTPEDNIYPVLWSEGDEIKIMTYGHRAGDGVGTKMSLQTGAGEATAVFEGEAPVLPEGWDLYYAVYPYSLEASIARPQYDKDEYWNGIALANQVSIPLPSVQKYAENSFGKDYSPALAVTSDITSEDAELKFKNVCGLLQINLTGNVTIGKITIEDNQLKPLWGTIFMQYRMREEPFWDQYIIELKNGEGLTDDKAKKYVLTLDCGEGVQLSSDEVTDFYFAIPVLKQEISSESTEHYSAPLSGGFTMRVYDVNGDELFTKISEGDNSIVRSKIRQMPVVDIRSKTFSDLSANGTANSYIVKPNTTAKFYAGFRGNSTYPVGNISSAVVLWETNMTPSGTVSGGDINDADPREVRPGEIISSLTYDTATGYVSLSTNNIGNAVIAVKDAASNTLWSWHIWVTDYDPEEFGATDTYNGAVMMDRNLGALGKVYINGDDNSNDWSDFGLRYDWGRKDPLENTDVRYSYFPQDPFDKKQGDPEMGYIDEFIVRHPTTFVPSDYQSKDNRTYLWGKKKTEHDPCPPGWQVTDFDVFYDMVGEIDVERTHDRWFRGIHQDLPGHWSNTLFNPHATFPVTEHWTNKSRYGYGFNGFDTNCGLTADPIHALLPVRCQKSSTVKPEKRVVNLSAAGTANSYIVKPGGHYKFKANVKGNSGESVGAISCVDVVYLTQNSSHVKSQGDARVVKDVYFKDGYIYFSTSLDKICGNAVIAVKDVDGTTLWSWHIWSVDYNPSIDYDLVEWGDVSRKVMKMNLGALSNSKKTSESLGMLYQWGRKDPYISTNGYVGETQCEMYGLTLEGEDFNESTADVWYSLQHPNRAMRGNDAGDWLAVPDNGLWAAEKTMYDPCPPGWKVPSRPTWEGEKMFVGEFDFGLTMSDIWYPASGYKNTYFNFEYVGYQGHYWYSTPKDNGSAYAFYFDHTTIDLANHADPKAQCNPVRCVAE